MRIGTGLTVISTLLVACGFPQPAVLPADAPPVDAGPDALVIPPNTVVGRSKNTCLQGSNSVIVPVDLSTTVIKALIPDATAAGYRIVIGAGSSDGTFVIHDVPDGMRYLLQFNNTYFDTASHDLDNGGIVPERCDPAPAVTTTTTPITFDLSHLSDVQPNDGLNAASLSLAVFDDMVLPGSSLSTATVATDWFNEASPSLLGTSSGLVDQTLGDDLRLIHHRQTRQLGTDGRIERFDQILEAGSASGVKMSNGSAATIPVAFTTPMGSGALTLQINRQAYDGGFDANTVEAGMEVDLIAHPIETDVGLGESLLQIVLDDWSGGTALVHALTNFKYADPFPPEWHRYMAVSYTRTRFIALPNSSAIPNTAFSGRTVETSVTTPTKTDNIVAVPSNIKLAGVSFTAGGRVRFDGTAPVTLTWGSVATAQQYRIAVFRVFTVGTATRRASLATLVTDQSSIQIPAQVFTNATAFAFQLTAINSPSNYSAGHLVPNGLPSGSMSVPSGLFVFSSTCGDGVVDPPGESCDGSGETAQCDVDCSNVVCGDGLRNAAAGEDCDTIHDTTGCNSGTCKVSVCGDNYVNAASEDCDFGGSNAGHGCGSNCRWIGICGDRAVGGLEQCDSGGSDSAGCDFDCTFAVCGDGYTNAAAGETCDDASGNGNDGYCGSNCKKL